MDCNSRYCYLDPWLGAQLAVAEALATSHVSVRQPLAITNCLNFGNPEKPAGYYQLRESVAGMADACRALDVVLSVAMSRSTTRRVMALFSRRPTIGCVGIVKDTSKTATMIWQTGDTVMQIGGGEPTLGGSEYLR